MTFELTEEQQEIIGAAGNGGHLKVKAYAGTGKTSTSVAMSEQALQGRRVLYLAFNKSIATEAQRKMPGHVEAKTAHSLAYRSIVAPGRLSRDRLAKGLMPLVRAIEDDKVVYDAADAIGGKNPRRRAAMAVAQSITRFCQSDRPAPSAKDVPRQLAATFLEDEKKTARLFSTVAEAAAKTWDRMVEEGSEFPITHDVYLKLFCMGDPQLPYGTVILDEAQDSNPVLVRLVAVQEKAQQICLGDTFQQIYRWRGAIDAMRKLPGEEHPLTKSWRFGENIAQQANLVLRMLGAELPLVGGGPVPGVVTDESETPMITPGADFVPHTVLCRGNSGVLRETLDALNAGARVAVVGGTGEVARLIEAAYALNIGEPARHAELSLFSGWDEFEAFSQTEEGASYKPVVRVVQEYGASTPNLCLRLKNEVRGEEDADVIVSTAHKAKGREWDEVRFSDDFRPLVTEPEEEGREPELNGPEANLVYVSITRAQKKLHLAGYGAVLEGDADRLFGASGEKTRGLLASSARGPASKATTGKLPVTEEEPDPRREGERDALLEALVHVERALWLLAGERDRTAGGTEPRPAEVDLQRAHDALSARLNADIEGAA